VSGGLRYRRILLKLSGEAFAESADRSLDSRLLTAMAGEIAEAVRN
jgi:uridylate kinase